jgi:hypothetical protein
MDGRVPLIWCVDVEPDAHVYDPDHPSPWDGFEAIADGSDRLRDRLSRLTGEPARFSWFLRLDPQIELAYGDPAWIVDRHGAFFEAAMRKGDVVGVHPHAWRWDSERRTWFADHEDDDWVDRCLRMSCETYRSRFGTLPAHHRFGGRFFSPRVASTLRELGVRFDLTLEPGEPAESPGARLGGVWMGEIPDNRWVPRAPYHPDRSDPRRPAADAADQLWMIPLSSARIPSTRGPLRLADRLSHPVRSARGLARRARDRRSRAVGPPYRHLRLWMNWPPPGHLWDAAFSSLRELSHPYLAFANRTNSAPVIEGIVSALERHPDASRLVFTTPDDALERLGLLDRAAG